MNVIISLLILGLTLLSCVAADTIRRGLATTAPTADSPANNAPTADAPASADGPSASNSSASANAPTASNSSAGADAPTGAAGGGSGGFDVTQYGAKPDDPKFDNFEAFVKTWNAACKSGGQAKMVIPAKTFFIGPVVFQGPCKGKIEIENLGTVKGTTDLSAYSEPEWFSFVNIDGLTITGGVYDAQGPSVWKFNNCAHNNKECTPLPASIKFSKISNAIVQGITLKDAKQFHMHLFDSTNLKLSNLIITAPGDSPNTDGIHLSSVMGVTISDSTIGTGDDCISIGQESVNVEITNITCGPGHGISIGSLAKRPGDKPVSGVIVSNCKLIKTTNGARIKTWGNEVVGKATNITYQDITMEDVANPIIINQDYGRSGKPSHWEISDVHFKNIKGTTPTVVAVCLTCSEIAPCKGVEVADIELTHSGSKTLVSSCINTKPTFGGKQSTSAC